MLMIVDGGYKLSHELWWVTINVYEPCLMSEIDCIRRFIFNVSVKMVGKINDSLQLLLGRHCIFDIKQILYDYRNGPKCSASFRAITMYLSDTVLIIG